MYDTQNVYEFLLKNEILTRTLEKSTEFELIDRNLNNINEYNLKDLIKWFASNKIRYIPKGSVSIWRPVITYGSNSTIKIFYFETDKNFKTDIKYISSHNSFWILSSLFEINNYWYYPYLVFNNGETFIIDKTFIKIFLSYFCNIDNIEYQHTLNFATILRNLITLLDDSLSLYLDHIVYKSLKKNIFLNKQTLLKKLTFNNQPTNRGVEAFFFNFRNHLNLNSITSSIKAYLSLQFKKRLNIYKCIKTGGGRSVWGCPTIYIKYKNLYIDFDFIYFTFGAIDFQSNYAVFKNTAEKYLFTILDYLYYKETVKISFRNLFNKQQILNFGIVF